MPLVGHLCREAGTMAVDLIWRDGRADLIAVGREILGSPSRSMGAALKLGNKGPFRLGVATLRVGLEPIRSPDLGTKFSTSKIGLELP